MAFLYKPTGDRAVFVDRYVVSASGQEHEAKVPELEALVASGELAVEETGVVAEAPKAPVAPPTAPAPAAPSAKK